MHETRPWLRFYGKRPDDARLPRGHALRSARRDGAARARGDRVGFLRHARDLRAAPRRRSIAAPPRSRPTGSRAGDRFLISMPTSPQGVIAFYAANRLGALPALIHPLSTAPEITHFLDAHRRAHGAHARRVLRPLAAATPKKPLERIVLARIPDYLSPLKRLGFWATKGRKIPPVPDDPRVRWWTALLAAARGEAPARQRDDRRSRGDPLLGRDHRPAEGHRAVQPQLHRPGPAGRVVVRHGREGRDPRDPADLPRLRARRVRERGLHGRRQVDPRAAVHRGDRREAAAHRAAQRAGGRAHALRRADQGSVARARRPVLPHRLLLRRRHAAARGEGALRGAGGEGRRAGASCSRATASPRR